MENLYLISKWLRIQYQFSTKTKKISSRYVLSDRRTLVETFYDNDITEVKKRFTIKQWERDNRLIDENEL